MKVLAVIGLVLLSVVILKTEAHLVTKNCEYTETAQKRVGKIMSDVDVYDCGHLGTWHLKT